MSIKSPLGNEGLWRNESYAQDELLAAAHVRVVAWLPYIAAVYLWISGTAIFLRPTGPESVAGYAALLAGLAAA